MSKKHLVLRSELPSINKIKKLLGYSPKILLEEGLKRTIQYYKQLLEAEKIKQLNIAFKIFKYWAGRSVEDPPPGVKILWNAGGRGFKSRPVH